MEKRIKTLYIVTIIAILAFLGMQAYWLYGRYELALVECERVLGSTVIECVDRYAAIRDKSPTDYRRSKVSKSKNDSIINIPTFEINQQGVYGDSINVRRKSTVKTYLFSAQELLGLEPGTKLTEEQQYKAAKLAEQQMTNPADSAVFDASGAKDDTEAWIATKNVSVERKDPFTTEGMDTVLRNAGISAHISIIKADSAVWQTKVTSHNLTLFPELTLTVPYSQLEGRIVKIVCPINPLDVLPDMWQTLLISLVISVLLIACLVLQFSTVLRLSRLDKMRNGFITTMIHELKRPISTLKMCVSGLDNERLLEDKDIRKELLTETRNALDNLSAYFSKLRDITFNNSAQIPLSITRFPLGALIAERGARISTDARKTVRFNNLCPTDIGLSADRTHFANILDNLLENAVKYSGDSVEITVSAIASDCNTVITVEDNGPGMSDTDCRKAFDRFYRSPDAASKPGMGLGLTYVRLLVEAHNGTVAVESRQGHGTRFTITIPQ